MRECGDCAACCVMGTKSIDLFDLTLKPCPYLKHDGSFFTSGQECGGCTVYANRPEMCQRFKCDYLLGKSDEKPNIKRSQWARDLQSGKMVVGVPELFGMWEE